MKKYWGLVASLEKVGEMICRVRRCTYKGRGRPRKSDFAYVKHKDILDFRAMEMLENGFKTTYTNETGTSLNIK